MRKTLISNRVKVLQELGENPSHEQMDQVCEGLGVSRTTLAKWRSENDAGLYVNRGAYTSVSKVKHRRGPYMKKARMVQNPLPIKEARPKVAAPSDYDFLKLENTYLRARIARLENDVR